MHELLVVLCAIVGFAAIIAGAGIVFDILDERFQQRQITVLTEFIEYGEHTPDRMIILLIGAELRRRTSMPGDYHESAEYQLLVNVLAHCICKLSGAGVQNQLMLLRTVTEHLNRSTFCKARLTTTTCGRAELIVHLSGDTPLVYIRFHTTHSIF